MSAIQLTRLDCPGCGAPLEFAQNNPITTCPYCDSRVVASAGRPVELSPAQTRMVPFTIDQATFEDALLNWLIEGDYTPDDILSQAMVREHTGLYVPLYRYHGTFKGSFTGAAGFDHQESYVDYETKTNPDGSTRREPVTKTRTKTDWRPMSGEVSGQFDVLALASTRIPEKWANHCESIAKETQSLRQSATSEILSGFAMEAFEQTDEEVYGTSGKAKVKETVEAAAVSRMPGDQHREVKVQWEEERKNTQLYQPFWLASFNYKDQPFPFLLDGTDATRAIGDRPVDENRKAEVKALFKTFKTAMIAWAITAFIGFFLVVPFFIALFVGIPHCIWLYSKANKEKKALLEQSRSVRQAALERVQQRRLAGA